LSSLPEARSSRPPLVCILADAFRHDYLSESSTPFLHSLAQEGWSAPLRPILGYSDGIRATIFTGEYPDKHGYWMEYGMRPSASPWAWARRFGLVDRFPSDLALRGGKMLLSMTAMRVLARRRRLPHMDLRNVPFRALPYFDLTLRVPMTSHGALRSPTIFDTCRDAGLAFVYLDSSKIDRKALLAQAGDLPAGIGLVFVYLHHIDMASHVFGIDSPRFQRSVRNTDNLIRQTVAAVTAQYPEAPTLVISDHGMSRITEQHGIPRLHRHPGFPSRFLFALDATMVRVWYWKDDPALRAEVREIVDDTYRGRWLTQYELDSLHLNFDSTLYGDEIFLLDPGTAIFPNFHSYIKPKAMHAYDPADIDQLGILIAPRQLAKPRPMALEMVDIVPMCHSLMGLANAARSATSIEKPLSLP
jgi:hypothetical protein